MEGRGETYQAELIRDLPDDETICFYKQGEYAELCDDPHITNTCQIKATDALPPAPKHAHSCAKMPSSLPSHQTLPPQYFHLLISKRYRLPALKDRICWNLK